MATGLRPIAALRAPPQRFWRTAANPIPFRVAAPVPSVPLRMFWPFARPSINVGASVSNRAWSSWPWAGAGTAPEALTRAQKLAAEAADMINCAPRLRNVEIIVHDGFLGDGYGIPTPEGQGAIKATARAEGVFLDPTYTGKAMARYRKLRSEGQIADADAVLFLHTGGAPSLFTAAVEAMP